MSWNKLICLAVPLVLGCASNTPHAADASQPEKPRSAPEEETGEPFRVLSPVERVPAFRVRTRTGELIDSGQLVGNRAFVVVFFATWCGVCELKLPALERALAEQGADVPVIAVSVDDDRTLMNLSSYLERHSFPFPVVVAQDYPRFALAYDPMSTVPAIAVVGKNGYLVDYQIGFRPSHEPRLFAALHVARRIPADAPPFLRRKRPDPSLDESERPR